MPFLGAHMPTAGGLHKAAANGRAIGCTALQVFTSNPRQWAGADPAPEKIALFREAVEDYDPRALVSHDTYLVNLAAPVEETREKSKQALIGELRRCGMLGIPYAVTHTAAHMKQGVEEGLRLAALGLREVLEAAPGDAILLMEITAGQGTVLNSKFEELAWLLDELGRPPRLGVCLDTCHMFASGYDLRTREAYAATMARLDETIGREAVKAIHVNDSKHDLGSRKDRHEAIGDGFLGLEAFRSLVNDPRWESVPMVLETPEAETMHEENLRRLQSLVA
jgi:deoxyribonuclease-4